MSGLVIRPNEVQKQTRIMRETGVFLPYTYAYVGEYTYSVNLNVAEGIEYHTNNNRLCYNLQIGKYNSIGKNLQCVFGKNHNFKKISTGAAYLMLEANGIKVQEKTSFVQKGNIIIQNDVWFGENVTIMPGTIIRNGAVVAMNSHVVSDVPPYAIVGGNPAKVIGYRYSPEQIDKLQMIAWWDWDRQKVIENAAYFTEDVDRFCDMFYEEAQKEFEEYVGKRQVEKDTYFVFVDYYENYSDYSHVLETFLATYVGDGDKKLILFVQDDDRIASIDESVYQNLKAIVEKINSEPSILCSMELTRGAFMDAKESFLKCSHYIATRTFDTVYFSCLADRLGIDIISGVDGGVDGTVHFERTRNMYTKE